MKINRRYLITLAFLLGCFPALAEPGVHDITFTARCDGSVQHYAVLLPEGYDASKSYDVLIALHGHGADRWQFIRDTRDECRAARDWAAAHQLVFISPDYRAKTSWMGPKAEADLCQIIQAVKREYHAQKIYLCGGSMGGTASLTFAALHPDMIHGVASWNGTANLVEFEGFSEALSESFGGSKSAIPKEYRKRSAEFSAERLTMPVGLAIGGKDDVVPGASIVRLNDLLQRLGNPVLLIHRTEEKHRTSYEDAKTTLDFVVKGHSK